MQRVMKQGQFEAEANLSFKIVLYFFKSARQINWSYSKNPIVHLT